jgi:hypothetical protein
LYEQVTPWHNEAVSDQHTSCAQEHYTQLKTFRQAAYGCLGNGRDALFELTDAVIQMPHLQSFVELSCAPAFRRKWSSAYEALQDGRPNRTELLQLYLQQLSATESLLVLAGDHTAWPRLDAKTLAERSFQHQPAILSCQRPVTIGHGYSTVAVIPEQQGSWALALMHERITDQKPIEKGAQQLRQICQQLPMRPLSLWDSEYGCAAFLLATQDIPADKLIRLRTNLALQGATRPYKGHGPHPKEGIPFKFKDPNTWWAPDQTITETDVEFGPVIIRDWSGLRFARALECRMYVACIEREQAPGTRRKPKLVWFGWAGNPPPEQWWHGYQRRYPLEHWVLPHLMTPQQSERWSDLMPLLTWELWLARPMIQDCPLPWQKSQTHLTVGRACQGMQNLLVAIGTPARACKPRGKAPGWPAGKPRARHPHYDLVCSAIWTLRRERAKQKIPGQPVKKGRPKKIRADPAP